MCFIAIEFKYLNIFNISNISWLIQALDCKMSPYKFVQLATYKRDRSIVLQIHFFMSYQKQCVKK